MPFAQTGPALANAQVSNLFSTTTTVNFKRRSSLLSFSTQAHEAEIQNNYGAYIQVPDLTATAAAERGVGDNWDARSELSANQVGITVSKHRENGFKIRYNTANEVPFDVMAQGNESMDIDMGNAMEDDFHAYLAGLTTKTVTQPGAAFAAADAPKADGTGDNGNAGKIVARKFGSSGNLITMDGTPSGDADGYIWDAIRFALQHFKRLNVRGGRQVGGMLPEDQIYMLLPVELYAVLENWLADKGLDWDKLNTSIYEMQGVFSTLDFEATIKKVNILTPNVLPAPTRNHANNPWVFYCGFPWATSFHQRPKLRADWGASENQTAPFSVFNQLCDYGFQLLQQQGLIRFEIATAA